MKSFCADNFLAKSKSGMAGFLAAALTLNLIQPAFANDGTAFEFSLPSRIGTITDSFAGSQNDSKEPSFVIIEDLHGNRSVQHSISGILGKLESQGWLPERIASEGLIGPFDVKPMQQVSDATIRRQICDEMIDEGNLYGEVDYVVTKGKGSIYGIEDLSLYKGSLDLVRASYDQRDALNFQLGRLQSAAAVLEKEGLQTAQERSFKSEIGSLKAFVSGQVLPEDLSKQTLLSQVSWEHLKSFLPQKSVANAMSAVSSMMDYYALALLRDQAIYNNLLTLRSMDQQKTTVLVVGGFHTLGLTQRMRAAGQSFIVLTPHVSSDTKFDEDLYLARLLSRPLPVQDNSRVVRPFGDLRAPLDSAVASFAARAQEFKSRPFLSRFRGTRSLLILPAVFLDNPSWDPRPETVVNWFLLFSLGAVSLGVGVFCLFFGYIYPRRSAKERGLRMQRFWLKHPEYNETEMIAKYGLPTVEAFVAGYFNYNERDMLNKVGVDRIMMFLKVEADPSYWLDDAHYLIDHFGVDTVLQVATVLKGDSRKIGQNIWYPDEIQDMKYPSELLEVKRIRQRFVDLIASVPPSYDADVSPIDVNHQYRENYKHASAAFELLAPAVGKLYSKFRQEENHSNDASVDGLPPLSSGGMMHSAPMTRGLPAFLGVPLNIVLYPVRILFQEIPHIIGLRASGVPSSAITLHWQTLNPNVEVFGTDVSNYPGAALAGIATTWAIFVVAVIAVPFLIGSAPVWVTALVGIGGVTALIEGIMTSKPHTVVEAGQVYTSDMRIFVDGVRQKLQNPALFTGAKPVLHDIYTTWDSWFTPSLRKQVLKTRAAMLIDASA